MTLEIVKLAVTTDASGDGSTADITARMGYVVAIGLDFSASAAAGTDTTITIASPDGPAQTILAVTDSNSDGWFYPRGSAVTTANAAITDSHVAIPISGVLTATVAQGGATVTNCVSAYIYLDTNA